MLNLGLILFRKKGVTSFWSYLLRRKEGQQKTQVQKPVVRDPSFMNVSVQIGWVYSFISINPLYSNHIGF